MHSSLVLIGAGGIGSRHFESLISNPLNLNIEVRDFTDNLRKIKENYALQISNYGNEKIEFVNAEKDFARKNYDFAIFATGASERTELVAKLLQSSEISNLILEKPLGNSFASLSQLDDFLDKDIDIRINLPRELMPFYIEIKAKFFQSRTRLSFHKANVIGTKWGLLSNYLHFIRIIEFLTNERFNIVETVEIEKIYETKRKGYYDFFGNIKLSNDSGNIITVSDVETESQTQIEIDCSAGRITINESLRIASCTELQDIDGDIVFQSQLTSSYFDLENKKIVATLPHAKNYIEIEKQIISRIGKLNFPSENNKYKFT